MDKEGAGILKSIEKLNIEESPTFKRKPVIIIVVGMAGWFSYAVCGSVM